MLSSARCETKQPGRETLDRDEALARWLFNKRKRAVIRLARVLEAQTAALADRMVRARRSRGRRKGSSDTPIAGLRNELRALIAEVVHLAGQHGPAAKPPARKRRRSRRG